MTNEEADEIVDRHPVPEELIQEIEVESEIKRTRSQIGMSVLRQVREKENEFWESTGTDPRFVVLSNHYIEPVNIVCMLLASSWGDNFRTPISTLWGMTVISTVRPNTIELY